MFGAAFFLAGTLGLAQTPSVGPRPTVGPQDRPIVDPAAVERGTRVWTTECITCHGASAHGSDTVPSLLHSLLVLEDRGGNKLGPFLKKGHPTQSGTPSANLTDAQAADVMQFLRQKINDTLRGSPVFKEGNVVTGDAAAGAAYFNGDGKCASCHSPTGNLAGIAGRYNPVDLQQRMLFPSAGRGAGGAPAPSAVKITVTIPAGRGGAGPVVYSGVPVQEDDFYVTLREASGTLRVIKRVAGLKVERVDPIQEHHELLDRITDKTIHDLLAYLETLK